MHPLEPDRETMFKILTSKHVLYIFTLPILKPNIMWLDQMIQYIRQTPNLPTYAATFPKGTWRGRPKGATLIRPMPIRLPFSDKIQTNKKTICRTRSPDIARARRGMAGTARRWGEAEWGRAGRGALQCGGDLVSPISRAPKTTLLDESGGSTAELNHLPSPDIPRGEPSRGDAQGRGGRWGWGARPEWLNSKLGHSINSLICLA